MSASPRLDISHRHSVIRCATCYCGVGEIVIIIDCVYCVSTVQTLCDIIQTLCRYYVTLCRHQADGFSSVDCQCFVPIMSTKCDNFFLIYGLRLLDIQLASVYCGFKSLSVEILCAIISDNINVVIFCNLNALTCRGLTNI